MNEAKYVKVFKKSPLCPNSTQKFQNSHFSYCYQHFSMDQKYQGKLYFDPKMVQRSNYPQICQKFVTRVHNIIMSLIIQKEQIDKTIWQKKWTRQKIITRRRTIKIHN